MILGIGTDITEVARFQSWADGPESRLLKIFSLSELAQCMGPHGAYLPEKLAARFAAKEAFYKALSATLTNLNLTSHTFSYMFTCQHISVMTTEWGVPVLEVDWAAFEEKIQAILPKLQVHLSLSHEATMAVGFVIITKITTE